MTESRSEAFSKALADRYAIEHELGAGGMATVYLAEDLKHKRKVAVKVLRPELAAVLGAERFVQEIETTANLQHPHILPLFDSGEVDSFLYYVMPFIEGETLRDKLNRETQLGIEEAVKITAEVADALEYAHRQNVIHRDIKPENILLHDGRPMVADFGIALAVSAAAGGRMTETGMSLGTPHYMSPEQATADKDLTNRSDIYSLGSVLYEMLTGEPPHTGVTAQAIVMKIVAEDVQPVTDLRKSVPPNVAAAVAKAVEKLPADRFESAAGFAAALVDPTFTSRRTLASAAVSPATASRWKQASAVLAVLAAVFFATTVGGWLRGPSAPAVLVTRFTVDSPRVDGVTQPFLDTPAISPDGTKLAYTVQRSTGGTDGVYVRALDRFDATLIPGTAGANDPFFSPDGAWVGFWADGALRKIPVDGGPVVIIAETGAVLSASWGANDQIVFAQLLTGLRRVPAGGGAIDTLTRLRPGGDDVGHYAPKVLPDGETVLFTATSGARSPRIALASMDSGAWDVIIEDALGAEYTSTGHVLFGRVDGSLWAVPFDVEGRRITGEPFLVMDQTVRVVNASLGEAAYAVADNGTMIFLRPSQVTRGELVWVDRRGAATSLGFPPDRYRHPRLSPDERQIAVTIGDTEGGQEAIWLLDPERRTRARFTLGGNVSRWPVWTHEGSRIAYVSSAGESGFDLFWKPVDGSSDAQPLFPDEGLTLPFSWSPVHQSVAYYSFGLTGADIWTLGSDGVSTPVVVAPSDDRAPMFSPDGRWLAYVSDESRTDQVHVRPYPGPGAPIAISSDGGIAPTWSRDGRELFYRSGDQLMVVAVDDGSSFGVPRVLFSPAYAVSPIGRGNPNYDVAADGRFLMVRYLPYDDSMAPLHVGVNFLEELKARVGT